MSSKVRVRFAPSPTGPLHIGGVRTALFNYLFAKKHKGDFLLRIEDTDQKRYVEGAEDYIINSLKWCNIMFDEGPGKEGQFAPYRQSERKDIYKKYIDELLQNEKAYYAFDTPEALDEYRKNHETEGKTFIYNWHNRLKLDNSLSLSPEETQAKLKDNQPYVIRFKAPQDEVLHLKDEIRGAMEVNSNVLDDKVLYKSDGLPTYHLANIVDDHLMQISHVIRGEEWLPSLPLHVLLYKAFDWNVPKFAHLPLILKPQGKGKLSKRDGEKMGFPVFPLEWQDPKTGETAAGYKEDGYFPEAVVNMLAFLGWNPGTDKEFFNIEELISAFDLSKVNKSGAKFDPEKTKWFQHHYFQQKDDSILAQKFSEFLKSKNIEAEDAFVLNVVQLLKERAVFITDLWTLGHYFFVTPQEYDEKSLKKAWKADSDEILAELLPIIEEVEVFESQKIQERVKAWINSKEIGFGKVMQPLRLAIVGALQGPDLYEIIALIGKEETIKRIKTAISKLK